MTEAVAAVEASAPAPTEGQQPGETKQEAIARMFKVKVDGNEREVSEEELLRGYTHGAAANEKMRVANEQRQMAEEVLRIFKTDPKLAFSKLGVDAKAFAEQVLNEHMEDSMLTDEQKELKKLRAWQADQNAAKEKAEADQKTAAEEAYRESVSQQLQEVIVNTLATGGLPKNEYTVGRMAYYMDAAVRAGYDVPIPELMGVILPQVKQEYEADLKALLGSTPEDKLLDFLGDDVTKKAVKAHLAKSGLSKKAPAPVAQPATAAKKAEIRSPKDFFKRAWQK
jgi:hypothetical protein